ncbi:MAG: hypothetical protein ABIN96_06455 [Rubrivivax sp.]
MLGIALPATAVLLSSVLNQQSGLTRSGRDSHAQSAPGRVAVGHAARSFDTLGAATVAKHQKARGADDHGATCSDCGPCAHCAACGTGSLMLTSAHPPLHSSAGTVLRFPQSGCVVADFESDCEERPPRSA